MPIEISEKTIKRDFIDRVIKLSGQDINQCFQCGTCGGACPMSDKVDTVPRKLMRLAQYGLEDVVSDSKAYWMCASCHSCSVYCPRGIDLARVMEAIRLITLRKTNEDKVKLSDLTPELVKDLPQIAMVSCFRKLTS